VLDLIERKAAGEEITVQPETEEPAAAPDLMAALEASLAAVKSGDEDEPKPRRRSSAKDGDGDGAGKSRSKAKAKT
jgi:DNA end-binding protein Ku